MTREPGLDWCPSLRPLGQAPSGSNRDYKLCSLVSISHAQFSCAQPVIVMAAVAGRGHWLHYCDSGFYAADTQGRDWIHKGLSHSATELSLSVLCWWSVYTPLLSIVNLQEEGSDFYLQCIRFNLTWWTSTVNTNEIKVAIKRKSWIVL